VRHAGGYWPPIRKDIHFNTIKDVASQCHECDEDAEKMMDCCGLWKRESLPVPIYLPVPSHAGTVSTGRTGTNVVAESQSPRIKTRRRKKTKNHT
jgi:hypothetical protein